MEAIIWVVSAIGVEAGSAALIMAAVEIGTAIYYTAIIATAYSYQQRQKRKARDQYNASQVDRLTNVVTTTGPRELVLGKVRKGGYILFRDSCGYYKERFVMVVALAAHEIDGVEAWYLNEKKVTLDVDGYVIDAPYDLSATETVTVYVHITPTDAVAGTVTQGYLGDESGNSVPYTTYQRLKSDDSKARIRLYKGTQNQTADARLISLFPGVWTSEHRLQGIAYAIVEFVFDESAFPSGLPNLTAVVKGAKVYDPRSGLTEWSENPALHMLHILQHPYFGKRSSVTSTELSRISVAANACEEAYTPLGSSTPVALYRSAIVLPFGGQAADAFDDIGAAMCGSWAYAGGEFHVKAGKYTVPVIELTEDDLMTSHADMSGSSTAKSVTINSHRARADKINTVNVKIYDADADYKETPLSPVKNSAAILKDGRELATDLTLPAVGSGAQGQVVANYMLKESFDAMSVTASFKLKAYQVELFDNIYLTLPRYGWNSKVFTVNGKKFDATGVVELSLRETSAELFNPLIASNSSGFASNTNLIEPWTIPKPENLVAASGTSELVLQTDGTVLTRVKVQWTSITDARITQGGFTEVQWQEIGSDSWNSVTVAGSESSCHLLGTVDGRSVIIRARSRYALAVSDWSIQVVHTVVGKTEPPNSVTGFAAGVDDDVIVLTWNAIPDADVGGYEIRTSDTDWGNTGALFKGLTLSAQAAPKSGTQTWFIRAYDRSGNYSQTSTTISYTRPAVDTPTGLSAVIDGTQLLISWNIVESVFTIAGYEVRKLDSGWGDSSAVYRGQRNSLAVDIAEGLNTFYVKAYDVHGIYSTASTSITFTKSAVPAPNTVTEAFVSNLINISWNTVSPQFGIGGYEVRDIDTGWGQGGALHKGLSNNITVAPITGNTIYIRAYDALGTYSSSKMYVISPVNVANVPSATHSFADTSLTAATVTLTWVEPFVSLGLEYYSITYGSKTITTKSNTITVEANWIGDRVFTINTFDRYGNSSSGYAYTIFKARPNPVTNLTAQVVDNNVLLRWDLPEKTSLPLSHVNIKEGSDWATARSIGTKSGGFTSLSELQGGLYTYLLKVVDTDNYESDVASLTVKVNQPPDFIWYGERKSSFAGTKVSAFASEEKLYLPVNTAETFEEHFTDNSWANPSSQVSAGYPVYIQPGLSTGSYEEVFDFQFIVSSSTISLTYSGQDSVGTTSVSFTLSVSSDNTNWRVYDGFTVALDSNFRYVRVKVTVSQATAGAIHVIDSLGVRLDNKLRTDAGSVEVDGLLANGSLVNFNVDYMDILAISVSPNSTSNLNAVYDFVDYLFTSVDFTLNSGTLVLTMPASPTHGLVAGQNVKLTADSTTPYIDSGVYTLASVSANTLTITGVTSSYTGVTGTCSLYPNSFKVRLFDETGGSVSGNVSWTARGS